MNGTSEGRLFRWGDGALLFWIAGLAGVGVGGVLPWSLTWKSALLLDAGLVAAGISLAVLLARLIESRGGSPVFLLPSVRQLLVLLLPLVIAVQAWLIHDRALSTREYEERKKALEDSAANDPNQAPDVALRLAVAEQADDQAKNAPGRPERKRAEEVKEAALDPQQPLPAPLPSSDLGSDPGMTTEAGGGAGGTGEEGSSGSADGRQEDGGRGGRSSPIEDLLRLVTGPLRALLGELFGLGGGEDYRRLATRVVLDLSQGKEPTPATLTELLEKLDPQQQQRALELLSRFIYAQKGLSPAQQNQLEKAIGDVAVPGAEASQTLKRLRDLLRPDRTPRPACEEARDALLRDGSFSSEREKEEVLRELPHLDRDECLPVFRTAGVRGEEQGD